MPSAMLVRRQQLGIFGMDFSSVTGKRFPNEPEAPIMKTSFPGPKVQENMDAYGETSCNK